MGRGGPARVSRPSRRPSLRSDGLRTGPKARPGSRLAPCLRGYGESNPTPPRLSPDGAPPIRHRPSRPEDGHRGYENPSVPRLRSRRQPRGSVLPSFTRRDVTVLPNRSRRTSFDRSRVRGTAPQISMGKERQRPGRREFARSLLTTRRREASRRRFLPSAKARSHTTRTVRSRRRSLKLVHARTRAAALSKGSIARAFTWLILPVVICLSQRLSHASVSTCRPMAKPRTAH